MPSTKPPKKRRSTKKTYSKVPEESIEVITRTVQIDCTSPLSVVISYAKLMEELVLSEHAGRVPTTMTRKDLYAILNTGKECLNEFKATIKQRRPANHAHGLARSICVASLLALAGYLASDIPVKAGDEDDYDPAPYPTEV